jgi:hypothetical protein
MGSSVSETVAIQSLTHPSGITSYPGTILRPADTAAYPGARPVVVLQHGLGGNQCGQWWTAEDLAGHGYVTVVWSSPAGANQVEAFINATDAMRSAIAFVRGPANPYAGYSDGSRIGLAGMSLGSVVTSFVQADPDPGVLAAVALDTLRRWLTGDPGGAIGECLGDPGFEVTPRVPALGFAMDRPCTQKPDYAPPDLKQAGYLHWRARGIPTMELVMAGYQHTDFSVGADEQQRRDLSYFVEAWFDRWLLGDPAAEDRLLADTVLGRPTASLLSTRFLSGAYLPPRIDTSDYLAYLNDAIAPETHKLRGPKGRISRKRARRGLKFSFGADDPLASFECRLDRREYKPCQSPKRIENAKPGRHTFRVRATDQRGNLEPKPAAWRYRITA